MTASPKFPMDGIPQSLWQAVAGVQSPGFADSYLYGAVLRHGTLFPRTVTAYLALHEKCSILLANLEIKLDKPAPFDPARRTTAVEELSKHFARKHAA